jgi:hypothetical protein
LESESINDLSLKEREKEMSQRSNQLTQQLEKSVAEFISTVGTCSAEQWASVCNAEGWTVAQVAQHVSGQFPNEMAFITAAAEGREMPNLSWAQLNGLNDDRAAANVSATKAQVLEEFRVNVAPVAAYLRALTDEQLDRKAPLSLADGAQLTTQQLIESGVLLAHVTEHLESIRSARPVVARRG